MDKATQPSSSMGCLVKGLIGVAICIAILIVVVGVGGYYVLFHTSLPIRGLVAMLNQDPDVQIEGVSGSLSSGFEVQKVRIKDENGKTNALDDIRLKYQSEDDAFVITDIHVGRGHLYIDRSKITETKKESSPDDGTIRPLHTSDEDTNARFIIQKISINDVTIEDVGSGEKFHLEKIELDSLDIGKEFSMGRLVVKSTDCDLEILPVDGAKTGKAFTVKGLFKPGLHENLTAPLDVQGRIDAGDPDHVQVNLSGFGGKVVVKGEGKSMDLRIQGLKPADYFKKSPPVDAIDLAVTQDETAGKAEGTLTIGGKRFAFDPAVAGSKAIAKGVLKATHKTDKVAYTIGVPLDVESERFFPLMQLTTKPVMTLNDAVAGLLYDKTHDALTPEEKKRVEDALPYFTVPGK